MRPASGALRPGVGLPAASAAYIRVSSRSQDYSYQRHAIEQACKARGEVIHRWYADVATGANMSRPHLRAMREAIRKGQVDRVWVWRLDRLTRSGIVDTLSAVSDIRSHGCELHSVSDGFALEGPSSEMVLAALAWAAQMEREKIKENQAAARARMATEGRKWGRPATPEPKRRQIVSLRKLGYSQRAIARLAECSKTTVHTVLSETVP